MKTLIYKALKSDIGKILFLIAIFICISNLSFADESSWRKEYNSICGNSHEAVLLSNEDLIVRIDRCKELLNTIKASDSPRKKIYIFRFEKCSNLYQYFMDGKKDEAE
jgi:hypothetical protein